VRLEELSWPELRRAHRMAFVVPFGATEQHGPHLPLGEDTVIAAALADGLAARRASVVVASPLAFGSERRAPALCHCRCEADPLLTV